MRVALTGASGQLGYDVARTLSRSGTEYLGPRSTDWDIRDRNAARRVLLAYRPDAVIHCAAYTRVDLAETDVENCRAVNVDGTRYVAEVCSELGAKLLYISTDYVFPGSGERPYETWDDVGPLNVYGQSKLDGELAIRRIMDRFFIVRTSWVIGEHGKNFIKTILRLSDTRSNLRVVSDQIGSPTFTFDLAPLLCDMIETEKYGVYHASNEGFCSWAGLAETCLRLAGKNTCVEPVSTEEYGAPAARPKNSRLSKSSLDQGGFSRLPSWERSLERFLSERETWTE